VDAHIVGCYVLVYADTTDRAGEGLGHRGGGGKRRAGAMIEAGEPSTGPFRDRDIGCARPTGDSYSRTTRDPAQRFRGAKAKAALKRMGVERGQGHYRGRD
jgi:hypothetical protein